ncbi:hypothetical protein HN954_04595 [bacterium]|jgi:hypothetical protein|nr:hypothetical protein [bacterium]MBT6831698.1 hypothetical protein [bacterium]MBT6996678.1 hypothetical protein [bacterium]MBT7772847.1 hypothetical protein [bacterium]
MNLKNGLIAFKNGLNAAQKAELGTLLFGLAELLIILGLGRWGEKNNSQICDCFVTDCAAYVFVIAIGLMIPVYFLLRRQFRKKLREELVKELQNKFPESFPEKKL